MAQSKTVRFAPRGDTAEIENGFVFEPKFDTDGLIPGIVTDAASGEVLMFAWMNEEALALTVETRIGHFWSRSRKALWKKGAESGNVLKVVEMRTDCDQDVIWISVHVEGDGLACHTGQRSCFYRTVQLGEAPERVVALAPAAAAKKL
jgi:phosphoribosyl-AMP cyclohydrolase